MRPKIISVSGKGGVGKSSILVLLLKYLIEEEKYKDILVIDADPDANIGDLIGKVVHFNETVGGKMTILKQKIQKRQLPLDVPKNQIIESEVFSSLIEMDNFDLLEMGRSEGSGCYCSVNNALKHIIDVLSKNYEITLIDAPAGLEYFARKTGQDVSDLIILTDASKMGFHTLERIIEVSKDVDLKFENIWVLGNKFPEGLEHLLEKKVEEINEPNIHFLGVLPNNDAISEINIMGKNLLELPNDNELYIKAKEFFKKIIE